jgi:hypothetical protein
MGEGSKAAPSHPLRPYNGHGGMSETASVHCWHGASEVSFEYNTCWHNKS